MMNFDRAAQLLHEFQGGKRITYQYLMDRYGISRRTAHRWIQKARAVLPGLKEERNDDNRVEFWVETDTSFQRQFLNQPPSEKHLTAIRKGRELLERNRLDQDAAALESIEQVIECALKILSSKRDPNLHGRVMGNVEAMADSLGLGARPAPWVPVSNRTDDCLRQALLHQRKVSFRYRSASGGEKRVTASPIGILYGGRPVLVAQVEGYEDFRHFRLDRMDDVKDLPDELHDFGTDTFSEYTGKLFGRFQDEPMAVEWRFHPSAPEVERWRFHPSQRTEKEADGTVAVRFTAGGLDDMARHVLGWWDWIEVVEPAALRKRVLQMKLAGLAPLLESFAPEDPDLARKVADLAALLGASQVPVPAPESPADGSAAQS